MSDVRGLSAQNMLETLPVAAANDEELQRQAEVIVQFLETRYTELTALEIYRMVAEMTDELPESILDTLAYDFKIDWWDPDYSLEEKRQTLRDNWKVHRTLGTKGAVETGLSAIYSGTKVQEWFEYDGIPYHFKILIEVCRDPIDLDKQSRVLKRLGYYKNLRSWLDYILVTTDMGTSTCYVGGLMASVTRLPLQEIPDTFHFEGAVRTGGVMAAASRTPVPEITGLTLTSTGRVGVRGAVTMTVPVPEIS